MFAEKFNYGVERAIIVALCLWGNWALYYWCAVLIFDASYISLKAYIPILLLQIAVSLFFLLRTDLGFSNASHRTCPAAKRYPRYTSGKSFITFSIIATLLFVIAVLATHHFQWTKSSLSYNLFWALLLPCSLAYHFYSKVSNGEPPAQVIEEEYRSDTLDCLLFCVCVAALAITAYGSGFPTWDDAFYGHVMSSTLANPALPIQGQDLLLNTTAPYSLHPAYRGVGYEILIALVSEAIGQSPLHLYFHIAPVMAVVLWSFSAYLFMRAIRAPCPGLAVAVFYLLLLFWGSSLSYAPSGLLLAKWWGKSLVAMIAAPLLFSFVAAFVQMQTFRIWVLLLLCVCTVAVWSSTALFVIPLSVGMACVVFVPSIRNNLPILLATALSLVPTLLLVVYSLLVLQGAPVSAGDTGNLAVQGEEFGGVAAKRVVLIILLTLPLLARTIQDSRFQTNILRVCMVGVFTIMAPFFLEAIAVVTGLRLLSFRLTVSYPGIMILGVMAGIAVVHLGIGASTSRARGSKFLIPVLVLMLYGALLATIDLKYARGQLGKAHFFESSWREGIATRKLIPKNAYVAVESLEFILPMLPDPPTFISIRHYLAYHKYFLSEAEYLDRNYLSGVLTNRLPREGESLDTTMDLIVTALDNLGVTTVILRAKLGTFFAARDAEKEKFVAALRNRLTKEDYDCTATPSRLTIVCNR